MCATREGRGVKRVNFPHTGCAQWIPAIWNKPEKSAPSYGKLRLPRTCTEVADLADESWRHRSLRVKNDPQNVQSYQQTGSQSTEVAMLVTCCAVSTGAQRGDDDSARSYANMFNDCLTALASAILRSLARRSYRVLSDGACKGGMEGRGAQYVRKPTIRRITVRCRNKIRLAESFSVKLFFLL